MSARDVIADAYHAYGAFDDHARNRGADAILAALRAAGYAVVPREATDIMAKAAANACGSDSIYRTAYRAMIAAAEAGKPTSTPPSEAPKP